MEDTVTFTYKRFDINSSPKHGSHICALIHGSSFGGADYYDFKFGVPEFSWMELDNNTPNGNSYCFTEEEFEEFNNDPTFQLYAQINGFELTNTSYWMYLEDYWDAFGQPE